MWGYLQNSFQQEFCCLEGELPTMETIACRHILKKKVDEFEAFQVPTFKHATLMSKG